MQKEKKISSIASMLREKDQIEASIKHRFEEYVTIMFTDIAGYTKFSETHGDLTTQSLLYKHNEILYPIIEHHSGNVIKTIGDAIMASFPNPADAVMAAVNMQTALKQYNVSADKTKKINIRIGLNAGHALRDGDDFFGDTVNVAARIESAGAAGQIIVSHSVHEAIKDDTDIISSYHSEKEVKGKARPLDLYRIFTDHDEFQTWKDGNRQIEINNVIPTVAHPIRSISPLWKYISVAVLLIGLFFLSPALVNKFNFNSASSLDAYVNGFQLLKQDDFGNARNAFLTLKDDDAMYHEGMAALAYQARKLGDAEKHSNASIKLNTDTLYPRVIKGNILFESGKYDEAGVLYKEALDLDSPLKWQKGEALFRLGRLHSIQNNYPEALAYYQQARGWDKQNKDIITAEGALLEKMGRLDEALRAFKTAQALAPEDAFLKRFSAAIEGRISAKKDIEAQKRIDKLVDQLAGGMAEKRLQPLADSWTSTPLTFFLAGMKRKGYRPLKEGYDEFFKLEITECLNGRQALTVVDRELLEKLLQELKLGSSSIADPKTALRIGRLSSARLIGFLTFIGMDNGTRVYLKFIETETTLVKLNLSGTWRTESDIADTVQTLVQKAEKELGLAFPVRARIKTREGARVHINVGAAMGLRQGAMMRVYNVESALKPIGAVKVTTVNQDQSEGCIINEQETIIKGARLEVVES